MIPLPCCSAYQSSKQGTDIMVSSTMGDQEGKKKKKKEREKSKT